MLVFILAGWYLVSEGQELKALVQLRPVYLFPLLAAVFFQLSLNGLITRACVSCFNIDLSLREWLGLAIITSMGNYLAPFRGGMAGKAVYLKKKHGFSYSEFLATVAASLMIIMLEGSLGGVLAVIIIYVNSGVLHIYLGLPLLAAALAILFLLTDNGLEDRLLRLSSEHKWVTGLKNGISGWRALKKNKGVIKKIAALGLVNYFLITAQIFFSAQALSLEINFLSAWFMAVFAGFTLLLSLTPANIGINEAVIGSIAGITGTGFNPGVLLASLIRLAGILIVFTLGPLCSYLLLIRDTPNLRQL